VLLCAEPCHESWREADAAQVALIRILLSMTGFWYEKDLGTRLKTIGALAAYVREVHTEYVNRTRPT